MRRVTIRPSVTAARRPLEPFSSGSNPEGGAQVKRLGEHMSTRQLVCVVLAAGNGTRMVSNTPKVMHELAGKPLLGHVVSTVSSLKSEGVYVVLRHKKELLEKYLTENFPKSILVEQDDIAGTGRAVEVSLEKIPSDFDGDILVVSADVPLMDLTTLSALVESHRSSQASATILTAIVEDPSGYGRIVRSKEGNPLTQQIGLLIALLGRADKEQ